MVHLHSKKPELILQEIFSAFILFNFSQAAAGALTLPGAVRSTAAASIFPMRSISAARSFMASPWILRLSYTERSCPAGLDTIIHALSSKVTVFPPCMSLPVDPSCCWGGCFAHLFQFLVNLMALKNPVVSCCVFLIWTI